HRLAQLRLGLHRALHAHAAEQPRGLRADVAEERSEEPPRPAVTHSWDDGRQRAHVEHDSVRVRAGEGREAVRADALSEITTRRHRSAAGQTHARTDARVHTADVET